MTSRLLRLALVFEFLVALIAIFTAWSEIGGQAVLDSMTWFWKFGFSVLLATAVVGYSLAIVVEDKLWTLRSARWLTGIVVIVIAMGLVTYYFEQQVEGFDGEESSTISITRNALLFSARFS